MSRLLFAAARSARVQRPIAHDVWVGTTQIWTEGNEDVRRIHPDDAHLQYGPISTALRKSAIEGTLFANANIPYIMGEYDFGNEEYAMMWADQTQRGVFKLLLAEALADEGL